MNKLYQAAEKAIKQSLRLRRGERFLLVTDKQKMEIAEALAFWAKQVGAETTTFLMAETLRPITEPPYLFKQMARKATAIAYMLDPRIEEKPFRGYMVKIGMERSRICMMPGLTKDMIERLVNIDFKEMDRFTKKVIRAMKDAADVLVENPEGTRIEFSVKGRKWANDNGNISRKGTQGNLPAGECYTAPVESTFSGKLVISLIDDKLGRGTMCFENGKLVNYRGKGIRSVIKNIGGDESGRIIGEFGIGTNKKARITPNMLEAEKAFGTAHFAIGDSYGLGENRSKHHYDALVEKVSIRAKGKYLAKEGKFLI
ncbi:MAG: aminopeptidase [Candidatus Aminicenantes bacterium]|nr:MAG: aminopeptidase [Candidatus Aminicenantes bacterium]